MKISNVQRFSLDDGPGIRTTVFLAGCNLRCKWCHNPETIDHEPRLAWYEDKCIHCGSCIAGCPKSAQRQENGRHRYVRDICNNCMQCIPDCPVGALEASFREIPLPTLLAQMLRDLPFYEGNGGVTFSGGEPMLQHGALLDAVKLCKEAGLHVAIDTAANVPGHWFTPFYDCSDLFLVDCKAVTDTLHLSRTGVSNRIILENIHTVAQNAREIWVRIPVIPGFNAAIAEMERIADFLCGLPLRRVELLPYHSMGIGKYQAYGIEWNMPETKTPDKQMMDAFTGLFTARGLPAYHTAL